MTRRKYSSREYMARLREERHAMGLKEVILWVPEDEKDNFRELAREARENSGLSTSEEDKSDAS